MLIGKDTKRAILILDAINQNGSLSMDEIAKAAYTNKVSITAIMAKMRKGKLVTSHCGRTGGTELEKPACQITVLDVVKIFDEWNTERMLPQLAMITLNLERALSEISLEDLE